MKNPVPKHLSSQLPIPVSGLLLLFQLLIPCPGKGQFCYFGPIDTSAPRTRNIIFTTPVARNSTINGLAIGFQPNTWQGARILNINGVSISASPIDPFLALFTLIFSLRFSEADGPKDDFNNRHLYPSEDTSKETYNGLIAGSWSPRVKCNGVNIAAIMNRATIMKGLSIAGLYNHHYSFKGVLIAGIRNKTTRGRGLQIGLLNRCQEGKLVQIGLLNRIGKRTIPFINFQF
jgi:hypothetical protein